MKGADKMLNFILGTLFGGIINSYKLLMDGIDESFISISVRYYTI